VERLVKDKATTLAWFDPATLVLDSPDELDLENRYGVSIRPVSLVNTIGIPSDTAPNDYWAPIYRELGLNYTTLPGYTTIVDEQPIQPYFNCEIFSVDPRLGICTEWAGMLTKFLKDESYQQNVCNTFLRRLFLHQAVLSAVIMSKVTAQDIKPLSIRTGYPFGQHDQLADDKKINTLNGLSAVIFDYQWEHNPAWMDKIPVSGTLKEWLVEAYIDYCKLGENIYRMEGSCNSYLITTDEGSVLIDPAGAASAPVYFKRILENHPLRAILLTHAHQDHWQNMGVWRSDSTIAIIAQRAFRTFTEYQRRLAPFFARRGAIWGRKSLPDPADIKPVDYITPIITFLDEYTYQLDGLHFKMTHTPGETPDHATIWIPELRAVFVGDNYYEYFINNATLRGTSTRPMLGYIHALDLALSYEPEFFLMGHGSPLIGKRPVRETVANFRDALQYIHDETIKGINAGKDVHILMDEINVPESYRLRPFFGKVEWTVRGVYHENIGWFDENPAFMYAQPPSSIYADLVDLAGPASMVKRAQSLLDNKEYVRVLHLTDVILKADATHRETNEIRLQALQALKAGTRNYIERIWLDYGIRKCEEHVHEWK
ncbi:MBL fold metallo-hydrolase, partial [candidate division KSB1 bacterium]|nr:MBL fold metallo-hydrolase [candidate division KSB1 bacterium]